MTRDTRERVLGLLRNYGWNATSFQVLEPGYEYWFDPVVPEAVVAYVDTGGAWVAAGAPIAAEAELAAVAGRFIDAAKAASRRAVFFATEKRFLERAVTLRSFAVGEQPSWRPGHWATVVAENRSLREQLRRARAKGVTVRPVTATEVLDTHGALHTGLKSLTERWQKGKPLAPMGFLVQLHLETAVEERCLFVAEKDGHPVGFLHAVPIFARKGWLFEDLLRAPDAPNGTNELLVDAAMRAVALRGAEYVTLGLAPLAGEESRWLVAARTLGRALYDFEGLRAFKAKLRPDAWAANYVSRPPSVAAPVAIADVLKAFARGSFLRFGLSTLMRGPKILLQTMTALLIPWTLVLALSDAERWFPSSTVKWAWVGFDVLLLIALVSLLRTWRRTLATGLAFAITLDAAVTLAQVLAFNFPRTSTVAGFCALGFSVLGPAVCAVLLWRAIFVLVGAAASRRRRRVDG